MAEDHVRHRVTQLLGEEGAGGYSIEFSEEVVGNSSPPDSSLASMLRDFVERTEPGAAMLPMVLPGFTDSHWFRKAFPECVAYGFFLARDDALRHDASDPRAGYASVSRTSTSRRGSSASLHPPRSGDDTSSRARM